MSATCRPGYVHAMRMAMRIAQSMRMPGYAIFVHFNAQSAFESSPSLAPSALPICWSTNKSAGLYLADYCMSVGLNSCANKQKVDINHELGENGHFKRLDSAKAHLKPI